MPVTWTAGKRSLHCKSDTSDVHEPKPIRSWCPCCKPKPAAFAPATSSSCSLGSPASGLSKSDGVSRTNQVPGPSGAESGVGSGSRHDWCHKCGESLARQDSEAHYLSKHAVTEVLVGDSTRKIVEMIFMAGWEGTVSRGHGVRIERILKVHNPETKLARFEECRETVKIKAHRLQYSKRHPRCLADGNELLRFYGTTVACSLGRNGSSSLCTLQRCNVCGILRHGFSGYKDLDHSVLGIFTTSTSEAAYKSIETDTEGGQNFCTTNRKALILCRVIAGRVHKPVAENSQELVGGGRKSGFDSLAGKLGSSSSHIEELYVLNSSALLPCFVIVCKP